MRAAIVAVRRRAHEPIDAASLGAFRALVGGLLVVAVVRHWWKGGIADAFVTPTHFFAYDGLSFVRPLPGGGMYAVYVGVALASAALALGVASRASAAVACLLFTYAHACDKANYLNHYYLVSLVLALAAVLPLDAALALGGRARTVPRWTLWLVRFQLGVVYFYGGVGKLGADWLVDAMPLRIWLAGSGDFPLLGPALRLPETAWVMSWLGAAFDLSIPFLLTRRRLRPFAYAAVVAFHAITARLFQIGMFPWLMIALTTIFFEPSWPRRLFRGAIPGVHAPAPRWLGGFAVGWVLFQALFPLRCHLFGSDVLWTEEGYRFSWRVMLIEKAGSAELCAVDPVTGERRLVRARDYLTPFQVKMMSTQPDMIRAFARIVADEAVARGERRPRVHADVVVTLNGRPPMRLVDPEVDLAFEPLRWGAAPWVLARSAETGAPATALRR